MIESFNDVEMRNSGVVYSSTLEQIKELYAMDPEQAGELAISAIELVLTGQISSDDFYIKMMLTPTKAVNQSNKNKYDNRVENTRQKKIREMKLAEIADLMTKGWKQREIGEKLGISQQNVSYRIGVIRSSYPELLLPQGSETAQTTYKENDILQTNLQIVYKNTNDTKSTNCTKNESFCKNGVFVENFVKNEDSMPPEGEKPHFYF